MACRSRFSRGRRSAAKFDFCTVVDLPAAALLELEGQVEARAAVAAIHDRREAHALGHLCGNQSMVAPAIICTRPPPRQVTLSMRMNYAVTIYQNRGATLDDLHEAVTTLEETEQIARRVFGGAHPLTVDIGKCLQIAREASTGSA